VKSVLIIKTSSLGDVIHTLPALTDAVRALGNIHFDWVVEENFAEIPAWHPAVRQVIPVALRRWRKQPVRNFLSLRRNSPWQKFKRHLQQQHYDYVIDAQGLLKSALLTYFSRGTSFGLDKSSAREPLAARFYQHPLAIARQQHAVERVRQLFAASLGYSLNDLSLDYGIQEGIRKNRMAAPIEQVSENAAFAGSILFLHGTTWASKHWPETYWQVLAEQLAEQNYQLLLPWGNEVEQQRAQSIKQHCHYPSHVRVLEKMTLNELLDIMLNVSAVVAVDTGLAHLAAALDKPTIALYGPTSPGLTGTYGQQQIHLQTGYECSPCFNKNCSKIKNNINPECYTAVSPQQVITALETILP